MKNSLMRAIQMNKKVKENRQEIIRDLIRNLKVTNKNASVEWLYAQKRDLEKMSDLQLLGML